MRMGDSDNKFLLAIASDIDWWGTKLAFDHSLMLSIRQASADDRSKY